MQPRRDVPHEASDYGHANPAYGRLQVDQITEALAAWDRSHPEQPAA